MNNNPAQNDDLEEYISDDNASDNVESQNEQDENNYLADDDPIFDDWTHEILNQLSLVLSPEQSLKIAQNRYKRDLYELIYYFNNLTLLSTNPSYLTNLLALRFVEFAHLNELLICVANYEGLPLETTIEIIDRLLFEPLIISPLYRVEKTLRNLNVFSIMYFNRMSLNPLLSHIATILEIFEYTDQLQGREHETICFLLDTLCECNNLEKLSESFNLLYQTGILNAEEEQEQEESKLDVYTVFYSLALHNQLDSMYGALSFLEQAPFLNTFTYRWLCGLQDNALQIATIILQKMHVSNILKPKRVYELIQCSALLLRDAWQQVDVALLTKERFKTLHDLSLNNPEDITGIDNYIHTHLIPPILPGIQPVNDTQSAHNPLVYISVARSLYKLDKLYPLTDTEIEEQLSDFDNFTLILQSGSYDYVNVDGQIPSTTSTAMSSIANLIALANRGDVIERTTKFGLDKVIALVWTGVNHSEHHIPDCRNAYESLIHALVNIHIEYPNVNPAVAALPACIGGIFDGLVNALNRIHRDVEVDVFNEANLGQMVLHRAKEQFAVDVIDNPDVAQKNAFHSIIDEEILYDSELQESKEVTERKLWQSSALESWYEQQLDLVRIHVKTKVQIMLQELNTIADIDYDAYHQDLENWLDKSINSLRLDKYMLYVLQGSYKNQNDIEQSATETSNQPSPKKIRTDSLVIGSGQSLFDQSEPKNSSYTSNHGQELTNTIS